MSFKSITILATAALGLFAGAAQAQVSGLANGGFEIAANDPGEFADGWQGNQTAPVRTSAEAHSGSFSALLSVPDNPFAGNGSGLFQNSVDHGAMLPVDPLNWGTSPTLTFWVKGNTSETGNLNYALRYLNSSGGILNGASAGARTIWTGNTDRPWTQITLAGIAIPVNTSAVFMEMTLATGPTGTFPGCGGTCNWGSAAVYLDDVSITLANPVPEPGTYALMLAGLACMGSIAARRRRAA